MKNRGDRVDTVYTVYSWGKSLLLSQSMSGGDRADRIDTVYTVYSSRPGGSKGVRRSVIITRQERSPAGRRVLTTEIQWCKSTTKISPRFFVQISSGSIGIALVMSRSDLTTAIFFANSFSAVSCRE
eukprot:COSAG02_NODE_5023_length_4719_cov_21.132900_5_plen_127_part_00